MKEDKCFQPHSCPYCRKLKQVCGFFDPPDIGFLASCRAECPGFKPRLVIVKEKEEKE